MRTYPSTPVLAEKEEAELAELVERLRKYDDRMNGAPVVEEAADALEGLVSKFMQLCDVVAHYENVLANIKRDIGRI